MRGQDFLAHCAPEVHLMRLTENFRRLFLDISVVLRLGDTSNMLKGRRKLCLDKSQKVCYNGV